jgi:hypothetical protein
VVSKTCPKVLEMCLASVIWQLHPDNKTGYFHDINTVAAAVPKSHEIRGHFLFRDGECLERLFQMVRCGFEDDPEFETIPDGQIPTLTGMSPHVKLIRQNVVLTNEVKHCRKEIKELKQHLPDQLNSSVTNSLKKFAEDHGHVTFQSMEKMKNEILKAVKDTRNGGGASGAVSTTTPPPPSPKKTGFIWEDGTVHALPEDFVFPKVKYYNALLMWFMPDTSGPTFQPAIRNTARTDYNIRKQLNKFSGDWRPLFVKIEERLKAEKPELIDLESWHTQANSSPSLSQVNDIWNEVKTWVPSNTAKGRKRHKPTDFKISYVKKELNKLLVARKNKKPHANDENANDKNDETGNTTQEI